MPAKNEHFVIQILLQLSKPRIHNDQFDFEYEAELSEVESCQNEWREASRLKIQQRPEEPH